MILSHIEYCFTNWSFAGTTVIKPIEQLFKRAIKVFDKKTNSYHHCVILEKYNLLNFESFRNFKSACFVYKCLNDLAPPPLKEFIHRKRDSGHGTRSVHRGDCEVYGRKTTFSQNVLSIKGCQYWNELPVTLREIPTFTAFKGQLKQWLKNNQSCDHVWLSVHNRVGVPQFQSFFLILLFCLFTVSWNVSNRYLYAVLSCVCHVGLVWH